MADAPEIKVKLTAEDTGVSAAIKELTSQLKNLKKSQDETATSGFSLANAFKGIVAAAGAIELARIGKDAFDSAVNIGKMADKTGLTTQTLSVFHHVAEEVGVSTEAVDKGLTRAAKSITEFQQGSVKAAAGFKLLGITQKDFQGLNPDQKIALVTTRLGQMSAGFQKATATQLIFSKGGAEIIPVANAIAGEGFDKITASVSKLGLLLDQDTTDSFRAAKASMQELTDVGAGMATQFEAGLLPAISDVAEALVDSGTQGGVSFETIGKAAGDVVRGIALVFLGLGQTLGTVAESIADIFSAAWKQVKSDAEADFTALGQASQGHLITAFKTLEAGAKNSTSIVSEEVQRQKAIYGTLGDSLKSDVANLFPSDAEEKKRKKERLSRLRPEKQTDAPEVTSTAAPTDAAARAALALLEKQLQDELAIHRAYAKQTEQIDTEQFQKGELSLKEYFDRRRAEVTSDASQEVDILRRGIETANGEAAKAAVAKAKAATPKEADKQEAARIQALTKVEELQTKIREIQIDASTKGQALDAEEFKKREENQNAILEFNRLIDKSQGNALEAVKQEIAVEQQKMQIILAQSGATQADIDKQLAAYAEKRTAEVAFSEEQKDSANAIKILDDQKAAIQDKVANGKLFQVQADQQILDLTRQQLPQLQQIADQLKANAATDEQRVQADDAQKKVDQLRTETNIAGQQIATVKQGVQSSLTGGLNQFFDTMVQGTHNVGQAFRGLASDVLSSIAKMIAQMYIQIVVTKLLKAASGGFAGGGLVPGGSTGGGGGFAEGGLIKGPGGPTSDSIPARLSDGEFVMKASAVSAIGAHNLEALNRGINIPSIAHLSLPKFAEGGLVGNASGGGGDSNINLGIGLDEGLILKHLSSKAAGNIILQHLTNNPKAASKALSRSQ
jgi:hypothetical protein